MSDLPIIVRDTREQQGFKFVASKTCAGMVEKKLDYGDYAIEDHLDLICIERKASVLELCTNFGKNRKRFTKEMQRMVDSGVKRKYIIVEDSWGSVFTKQRFTKMSPNSIFGSIISFMIKYDINFIFAENRDMAHKITRSLIIKAWETE